MSSSDPWKGRGGGSRRGLDRPPGWTDSLLAGRSRADKEADQDAQQKAMLLAGVVIVLLVLLLRWTFGAVGLALGWWSAPAFAPVIVWSLVSVFADRLLRPVEIEQLGWPKRLKLGALLLVSLWALWGVWAGPAARAWKAAHGGFLSAARGGGASYPLHAVLAASPVALGIVAFLLLAVAMVLFPRPVRRGGRVPPTPPGGPEPLRPPLMSGPRHPRPGDPLRPPGVGGPRHPRPPYWR